MQKRSTFVNLQIDIFKNLDLTFTKKKYQCKDCVYSYNPKVGDPTQGINPGVAFEELPETWLCPVCGSTKNRFRPI